MTKKIILSSAMTNPAGLSARRIFVADQQDG
jgi:hypothetical protein